MSTYLTHALPQSIRGEIARETPVTRTSDGFNGKLITIGHTLVQYKATDRISSIGQNTVQYHCDGRIKSIGKDNVRYNSNGRIIAVGSDSVTYNDETCKVVSIGSKLVTYFQ